MCWPGSSGSHLAQDRPVICSDYLRFARALGDLFRCLVCVCFDRGASRYQGAMSGRAADGMIRSVDLNIQIPKAGLGIFSTGQSSRGPAPDPKIQTGLLSILHVRQRMRWSAFCSITQFIERVCEGLRAFLVGHSEDSSAVGQVMLALLCCGGSADGCVLIRSEDCLSELLPSRVVKFARSWQHYQAAEGAERRRMTASYREFVWQVGELPRELQFEKLWIDSHE